MGLGVAFTTGDDARLASSEWELGCGVLEGHPPRQVVDGGRGDGGKHADAAHRRTAHGQVVDDQVAAHFQRRLFVPHARHQERAQVVDPDSQPAQLLDIQWTELEISAPVFAAKPVLPRPFREAFAQEGLHDFGNHE